MAKVNNIEIRRAITENRLYYYEVAEALGINDGNLSRKLRKELPQEEKEKILEIIDRLVHESQEV